MRKEEWERAHYEEVVWGRTLHDADEYSVRIYSTWVLKSKREGQKEK
ncbi:MAG: hypothetical protein MR840_04400 [Solobacterium sp.]|nr:hypothetical protein [Solobacterium sp.]MCI7357947.1 hypothetical protein [Parabacteroides sp.]